MAFQYNVTIAQGSFVYMNAVVGGTSTNITYFYDVTLSPNTINILSTTTSGTNTTDGISFNNTHITSFPPPIDDSSEYYVLSNNGSSDVVYTSNNLESENIITLTFSPNTLCFNQGTKILYMNQQLADEYIAIELLNVGDFVKTFKHGYRKISKIISGFLINNPKKWNICMYKMAKTESNGLLEDLIVTGGHSILVDSLSEVELAKYLEMGIPHFANETIDKKHLVLSCVSDDFVPMPDNGCYKYYHLLLENNNDEEERFGIYANGVLTETPNVKTVK